MGIHNNRDGVSANLWKLAMFKALIFCIQHPVGFVVVVVLRPPIIVCAVSGGYTENLKLIYH